MDAKQIDKHYTYADYCTWNDNKRYELIDGIPYMMSPAPFRVHQEISGSLYLQIAGYLKNRPCKIFYAPFDVRLNASGDNDDTVIQPDLLVVCDLSKLDSKGCNGAPDMIIEILSPSTARHDKVIKYNKYLQAGVREYWMVDPDSKTVQVCILHDGNYIIRAYSENDIIPVHVLEYCKITLNDVFAE